MYRIITLLIFMLAAESAFALAEWTRTEGGCEVWNENPKSGETLIHGTGHALAARPAAAARWYGFM